MAKRRRNTSRIKTNDDFQDHSANVSKPLKHNHAGMERMNAIPDYTQMVPENIIEKIIAKFYFMTPNQLVEASTDTQNTTLERSILDLMVKSVTTEKGSLTVTQYLHNRMGGKVKERVEHSGPGGNPLEIRNQGFDVSKMSREERAALKKLILDAKKLPTRKAEDDGS